MQISTKNQYGEAKPPRLIIAASSNLLKLIYIFCAETVLQAGLRCKAHCIIQKIEHLKPKLCKLSIFSRFYLNLLFRHMQAVSYAMSINNSVLCFNNLIFKHRNTLPAQAWLFWRTKSSQVKKVLLFYASPTRQQCRI